MKAKRLPIVRRGQKTPYVRGSQAQRDERVGFVARLLAAGARKMQLHRAVRQRFNIQWRQCDRYLELVISGRAQANERLMRARQQRSLYVSSNHQLAELARMVKIAYPNG